MKPATGMRSFIALLFVSFFLLPATKSSATAFPDSVIAVKSVLSGNGYARAGLNDKITVSISQSGRFYRSLNGKPLVLFINGLPLKDLKALSVDTLLGEAQFVLERTDSTKSTWTLLLGKPKSFTKAVTVSVGLANGSPIPCNNYNFTFIVIRIWQFWIFVCTLAAFLLVIFLLYKNTDLLRGIRNDTPPVGRKMYSLALSQMLFWTVLVVGAFVFIWVTTGDINTVTDSALILMGISSATALSARAIDTSATGATSAPELTTNSFWKDILHGTTDYEPHRLQIVVWTLVLGIVFIFSVWNDLTMPDFNGTLLTLMGISSGVYVGFKYQE